MSGCPEANADPRPCTQTSAGPRRRLGSAITPASNTPSRVRTLTSETGTPEPIAGRWPGRRLRVHRAPVDQREPAAHDAVDEPQPDDGERQPGDEQADAERGHHEEQAERH